MKRVIGMDIHRTFAEVVRWSPKFGQEVKLGSLLRKTDLDDEQTETVFS